MKNGFIIPISLFVCTFLCTSNTFSQTAPINPSRGVIGSNQANLPTWDWELQNVPLVLWDQAGTWQSASMAWKNPSGKMIWSLANYAGAWHTQANAGDGIFRIDGANAIFQLNSDVTKKMFFGGRNSHKTLVVGANDKVGIGTDNFPANDPNFRLYVRGGIKTEEVRVELCTGWCDYVFEPTYKLQSLADVDAFIKRYKHLPNIPSAKQLEQEGGIDIGKMTTLQQEKIEELFLHVINLEKRIKLLEAENAQLKQSQK
jgi:hypothetical protein